VRQAIADCTQCLASEKHALAFESAYAVVTRWRLSASRRRRRNLALRALQLAGATNTPLRYIVVHTEIRVQQLVVMVENLQV
jgi:hypothetical protein